MPPSKAETKTRTKSGAVLPPTASAKAAVVTPPAPGESPAPAVSPTPATAGTTIPPVLEGPDAVAIYQALYDSLGRAYWESSDLASKDTIQGARDAVYDVLTDLNIAKLKANTALYLALIPKIKHSNEALKNIQGEITNITKNITTAASVISAITKVLNIAAMF